MNDNSSNNPSVSAHHGLTAEAISRRAYELWEKEGRPESRDLHHWLRAEQELLAEQQGQGASSATSTSSASTSRAGNTDTQPLSRTGSAPKTEAKSAPKRSTPTPFPADKSGRSSSSGSSARASGRS